MKVINSHKRIINQPIEKVSQLFKTLATLEDLVWPHENWPAIKFKNGLQIGSKGGHGPIRYTIIAYKDGEFIKLQFTKPKGFIGTHELKIHAISNTVTQIVHEIKIKTSFKATFSWVFIIRWLHDALIEDAFDKVENYFIADNKKKTEYNFWVRFLRQAYKRKPVQPKHR